MVYRHMDVNAEGQLYSKGDTTIGTYLLLLIKSLRPEQYYKNLLLFVGVIFSSRALDVPSWTVAIAAFFIYCMLSGSCYAINDVLDIKRDRVHPVKSMRPIASGRLGVPAVVALAAALAAISLLLSYIVSEWLLLISLCFILSNVLYNLLTNSVPLLDAVSISANFVIRIVAGCFAIGVAIPFWITLCVFILAILLVFGKRRSELVLLGGRAGRYKRWLFTVYDVKMLDILMGVTSLALLAAYVLYVYYSGSVYVILTVPLVVYGVLRYFFLVRSRNIGEVSDMLLSDARLVACMVIWIILNTVALYS